MTTSNAKLDGKTIAILATDGFEQSELVRPMEALKEAGAEVHVVTPDGNDIKGWNDGNWGDTVKADRAITDANADAYDALVLPGGVMNPDTLRMREDATTFVREFFKAGKPVSAICHAPWLLIDCGVVEGREITSWPSLKSDLKNAGARWVDKEVVCDQALTTSRSPDDLPAFIDKTIEEIREGKHAGQKTA
ncbi:MAG: type 1 glutamine amidotransferase domain-containing protein [Phycisphaerales bacterium]|jgi:protease I